MAGQRGRGAAGEAGQAIVELALLLPLLALLLLLVLDFGRAFSTSVALANAAREGARYCALNQQGNPDKTAGTRERARAAGGVFVPGMTGQPALDARFLEQYRPGLPALDAVLELARALLPRARVRERSIAAAELWDGVMGAQAEALAEQAPPPEALERRNGAVQRALDQAWIFAPRGGAR